MLLPIELGVWHYVCEPEAAKRQQTRVFGTFTCDLLALTDWLQQQGVTQVAMEATGVYWRPVWAVLEGHFEQMLVNQQHIKAAPGRKSDTKDCEWIADLLQHGLLKGSFVPPAPIQDLRDLTRYQAELLLGQTLTKTRLEGDSRTSHRRGLTNHFRRRPSRT